MNEILIKYQPFIKEVIAKLAYEVDLENLEDLQQDINLILLEQRDKVIELESKNELKYFIVAVITNQLRSVNSPYYKIYKKMRLNSETLENYERDDNTYGEFDD